MSQLVFSCLLKSKDGGQTFYDVRPGEFRQFKEKLRFNSKCVNVDRIPNGPVVEALAEMASDSTSSISYIKLYGNCSQYNSLKPRWIEAHLRPQHVLSNFSIAKDLILSKLIADRATGPSKCFMIIDRKLGGFYVDYNLFPVFINSVHGVVTNWKWIEYVNFVMQLFLLCSKNNALILYEVMLDYCEQQGDVPSDISYSIRFMAESDENKLLIEKFFHHLKLYSLHGPVNPVQHYFCSGNISDMSNTLDEIKRLTLEIHFLYDSMRKSNDVIATTLLDIEDMRSEINLKWDNILALANSLADKILHNSANEGNSEQIVSRDLNLGYSKKATEKSHVQKEEKKFGRAKRRSNDHFVDRHDYSNGDNNKLSVENETLHDCKGSEVSCSAFVECRDLSNCASKQPSTSEQVKSFFTDCKDPSEWDNEEVANSNKSFGQNPEQSAFSECKDQADRANEFGNSGQKQQHPFKSNSIKKAAFKNCPDVPQNASRRNINEEGADSDSESFVSVSDKLDSISVTTSQASEKSGGNVRFERFMKHGKLRREKNVIITGMVFEPDDDLVFAVEELCKEVLGLEIRIRHVIRIGDLKGDMLRVALKSVEDRDSILKKSKTILPVLKSRVVIREDRSYAERKGPNERGRGRGRNH